MTNNYYWKVLGSSIVPSQEQLCIINDNDTLPIVVPLSTTSTSTSTSTTSATTMKISEPSTTDLQCRTCNVPFDTIDLYREHYKSTYHRFNLKLKIAGAHPVTEREFKDITDVGELSSSESEEDEKEREQNDEDDEEDNKLTVEQTIRRNPRITFTDGKQTWTLFRSLLEVQKDTQAEEYLFQFKEVHKRTNLTFIMVSGGHFSGAVFAKDVCVAHKSFHRYTTRKKQGGSQSTRDNKSATSGPQSAGAQIRRHNETKLKEEIIELLTLWSNHLRNSDYIFIYAPGEMNKKILFSVLDKTDPRVKSIPVPTIRRPTFSEIKKVHQILSTVEIGVYEAISTPQEHVPEINATEKTEQPKSQKVVTPTTREDEGRDSLLHELIKEHNVDLFTTVYDEADILNPVSVFHDAIDVACTKHKLDIVKVLLANNESAQHLINSMNPITLHTALCTAAASGYEALILLLLDNGADVCYGGSYDHKKPYDFCTTKETRLVFRKYFGDHTISSVNFDDAHFQPITSEELHQQKQKQIEKSKKKKVQAKERQKAKKENEKEQKAEQERQSLIQNIITAREERLNKLTEREKRAEAAERRLGLLKNSCDVCHIQLTAVPFQFNELTLCSENCIQQAISTPTNK